HVLDEEVPDLLLPRSQHRASFSEHVFATVARRPDGVKSTSAPKSAATPGRKVRWRGLEPPRPEGHKALNLARLPIPPPARGGGIVATAAGYFRRWNRPIVSARKIRPTTTVSRVRFRSTMCVPPCEAGVKPIPPSPVSRPECIRMSPTRAIETRTWKTASAWSTGPGYQRP